MGYHVHIAAGGPCPPHVAALPLMALVALLTVACVFLLLRCMWDLARPLPLDTEPEDLRLLAQWGAALCVFVPVLVWLAGLPAPTMNGKASAVAQQGAVLLGQGYDGGTRQAAAVPAGLMVAYGVLLALRGLVRLQLGIYTPHRGHDELGNDPPADWVAAYSGPHLTYDIGRSYSDGRDIGSGWPRAKRNVVALVNGILLAVLGLCCLHTWVGCS